MTGRIEIKPMIMGAAMGVMMLMPLHAWLTGDGAVASAATTALVAFVAGHVLMILAAVGTFAFLPSVRRHLRRHIPSGRHLVHMSSAAVICPLVIHLIHGMP